MLKNNAGKVFVSLNYFFRLIFYTILSFVFYKEIYFSKMIGAKINIIIPKVARRSKMKKIMVLVVVISLAIFMLFSASGCNLGEKIAEKATEKALEKAIEEGIENEGGGEAEVDIDEGKTKISTDEGEFTIGQGAELPDGFPDVVPVYSNITILSSLTSTENGLQTFSVSGTTGDSVDEVFDWYESQLGGWAIENESTSESNGEKIASVSANNGTYYLWILISGSDEETTITFAVNELGTTGGASSNRK